MFKLTLSHNKLSNIEITKRKKLEEKLPTFSNRTISIVYTKPLFLFFCLSTSTTAAATAALFFVDLLSYFQTSSNNPVLLDLIGSILPIIRIFIEDS